jgi:two-component system, response regulator
MTGRKPITILMAEDDPDDRMLARDAFAECRLVNDLRFVENGEKLLDYLNRRPPYTDSPRPGLILLDLNMPIMDGREALALIKADPLFRTIPVIALTTSHAEEDILRSYESGINSYIVKPVSFSGLVDVIKGLAQYWLEIVEIPGNA